MDEDEAPNRRDHRAHVLPGAIVRRDRRADRDAPVLRDLGRDVADAANVDITMLLGEAELGGQMLADDVPVQQRH